jgi:hypothetical protein
MAESKRKTLNELSSTHDDEEKLDYMSLKAPPPSKPLSTTEKVVKEIKQNWWLWGSVVFAVMLIGSLVVFRHKLYGESLSGLPSIAVKENAAETCRTECEMTVGALTAVKDDAAAKAKHKESFDACYSKCTAESAQEVAVEREQFKESEKKFEKMMQQGTEQASEAGTAVKDAVGGAATAVREKAADTGSAVKDAVAGAVNAVKDKASSAQATTAEAKDKLADEVLQGKMGKIVSGTKTT